MRLFSDRTGTPGAITIAQGRWKNNIFTRKNMKSSLYRITPLLSRYKLLLYLFSFLSFRRSRQSGRAHSSLRLCSQIFAAVISSSAIFSAALRRAGLPVRPGKQRAEVRTAKACSRRLSWQCRAGLKALPEQQTLAVPQPQPQCCRLRLRRGLRRRYPHSGGRRLRLRCFRLRHCFRSSPAN